MNILNRGYWVTTLLSVVGLAIATYLMMQTNGGDGATAPADLGLLLLRRHRRPRDQRRLRLHHPVLHRRLLPPGPRDRRGVQDRPRDQHHRRHRRRLRDDRRHGDHHRHRALREPLAGRAGGPRQRPDGRNVGGIFGTAVATMGMLMTTAYILAMDTFGPITDNAGGIAEFSRAEAGAREITDRLDAVGNTTKALTKGYAIASASLAAFLLFSAYIDKINLIMGSQIEAGVPGVELLNSVNLANVNVFIAALIAAMLVYFFSSLAIRAVGNTAQSIIVEVRRQFREMPGIMDYTQRPDYARVVDITTKAALKQMIAAGPGRGRHPDRRRRPARLPRRSPACLMVGTIAGVLLATVLNNGGGAWDNAKKYIESGHLKDDDGNVLGKSTDAHAAAVVGDTVGDPFKDTAGPSLHVLVKLLATITLVLAPLFIR